MLGVTRRKVLASKATGSAKSLVELHSLASSFERKRRSAEERMEWLGIDDRDYRKYEEMFLKCREQHHFITPPYGKWIEIKHAWKKNDVTRHLTGGRTIGLFPAAQIDYLMIDIDRHNQENHDLIKSRIDQVIETIGGDPLIYQSSFSRGMRLCFFLPKPVAKQALYKGCKGLFQRSSLVLKSGSVEIMATRTGDRLPFGEGSYLVDSFTLEPIWHLTPQQTITEAFKVFQFQKVGLPFNVCEQAGILVPDWQGGGIFNQTVSRLLDEGLYPEITTNRALMWLSWDLICRKRCSKEETKYYLRNWIQEKHNRCSKRVNSGNIENIFAQIERIVKGTDRSKAKGQGSRYAVREKKLSLTDVRKIVSLTHDPKLQLALFSVLEYCLNFGKTQTKNKIGYKTYASENDPVTYVSEFQEKFYCEIAQENLRHLNGFDKANPQMTRKQIEKLGVLSLKRESHPRSHHCRQYWVHFRFDGSDPVRVVSLEEGLAKLQGTCKVKEQK
jgi:hypothetical protein